MLNFGGSFRAQTRKGPPMAARRKKKTITPEERERRRQERKQRRAQRIAAVPQLLYSRDQTAHVLGDVSVATVIRMEVKGVLDKVRMPGSPNGAVYHRAAQVHALASGRGVD